ncbi:MAG: hypothetical protein M1838_004003 [Thelocarpon superellum]|nr:MAG: hypothetical protein M1838_004003 [Thelocarpon superellum]
MSKVIRSVKNVTKGYSSVQVKVRNATSNDPWGPTGTDMAEIAQMTFNSPTDFYEIMDMLDKRLNDRGKNWRHVLKALKVLDYCLHEGSELVVTWARKNIYIIKTLREFQHIDEDGRDVGQNVRVSAKELTSLILDEERLRTERSDRKTWKSRVTGIDEYGPSSYGSDGGAGRRRPERRERRADEDDAEYRLAIEASKHEAEEERKRRQGATVAPDDDDLAKAIKLSKEEEELRRKELEQANEASLFDDTPVPSTQPQFTGYNQGYQQQGAVDWSGNPLDQAQQPMVTGYVNPAYPNTTGFSNQPLNYQGSFSNGFGGQPSVFDQPSFAAVQPQPTQNFLQPQTTAFGSMNNPYAAAGNDFAQMNQPQAQAPAPPQPAQSFPPPAASVGNLPQAGTNNPWSTSHSTQAQQDALKPMPTGSNNPFASSVSRPGPPPSTFPTLDTLSEQKVQMQFNNHNFNPPMAAAATPAAGGKEQSPHHARLNALLASGEGMDTFGNTGDLRIPAQHTAPGTFINSAGSGLNQQQTGNNPFFQQQFTGVPQHTGFAGSAPSNRFAPAQTGPANYQGAGGSPFGGATGYNAFGASAGQPGSGQAAAGGSLIDL